MSSLVDREWLDDEEAARNTCILVVERDEASAEVFQAFLKTSGFGNVVTTLGATAVLDLLYDLEPDLLLVDSGALRAPDGSDLLESIRATRAFRHVPVLVLAAQADREMKLQVLQQGVLDVLIKPVDPAELVLRLRNVLLSKLRGDRATFRDDLTGLANRERYTDRLQWAIRYSKRYGAEGAVLHIDLDRFKQIVSALGWGVGDRVLRAIANNLAVCVRDTDVIAQGGERERSVMLSRLSGNEFTVLLSGIDRADSAAVVADRILHLVQQPMQVAGRELITTCSIGIAVFPSDGNSAEEIISAAVNALQHAKREGGNTFRFFARALNDRARHRLALESDLRVAVDEGQLGLVYQPKVRLDGNRITGAEALVRWIHPQRGVINPMDFIPVAEECGLIHAVGDWVLRETCRQIRAWREQGLAVPRIAINVSVHQFRQAGFADGVAAVLTEYGLEGSVLGVELTESAIMENTVESLGALQALKDLGIELSIDDFGTGYSSLGYLKRFPLHILKIDRSFMIGVGKDEHSAAIVSAIISIGHRLGLRVVAEGVDTARQLEFLASHGCDEHQSFLFSRPLYPDDFVAFLKRHTSL